MSASTFAQKFAYVDMDYILSMLNNKNKYDDYGANAVTITGDYNTVEHNIISGAWAESQDYGWNGGAFEFFNSSSFNKISNNTVIDCAGLAEFGGLNKNQFSKDNTQFYDYRSKKTSQERLEYFQKN
jgi:hypothetical protein